MKITVGGKCLLLGILLAAPQAVDAEPPGNGVRMKTLDGVRAKPSNWNTVTDNALVPSLPSPPAETVPSEAVVSRPLTSDSAQQPEIVYRRYHSSHVGNFWHGRVKPWLQSSHWGYPEYFEEPALGASTRAYAGAQIASGEAARMVFYEFDFMTGRQAEVLSPRGMHQLRKIALLAERNPFPILLEPSGDPALDAARLATVTNALTQISPTIVPEERVVLAEPAKSGLSGKEAVLIQENVTNATRRRGTGVLLGTGGTSTGTGTGPSSGGTLGGTTGGSSFGLGTGS